MYVLHMILEKSCRNFENGEAWLQLVVPGGGAGGRVVLENKENKQGLENARAKRVVVRVRALRVMKGRRKRRRKG